MGDPQRVLLVRPSALGDVCRTVPVLASLRRAWPDARIDWLVQRGFEPAIEAHPDLHRAIPFDRKAMGLGRWLGGGGGAAFFGLVRTLRAERYDLVIDCQGLLRSAIFARASGSPRRAGFADARELSWLLLNERYRVPGAVHTVDRMLGLVEALGIEAVRDMRLYTSANDRAWVAETVGEGPYAVLAPTSRWTGKRWPAERFAEIAQRLLGLGEIGRVVCVGGKGEAEQCTPLRALSKREPRLVDLVGRTDVGRLLATVAGARFVIANDSAVLHMAVGFDRPLVGVFGPTATDLVGPYGREADVVRAQGAPPSNQHKSEAFGTELMQSIGVEPVWEMVSRRVRSETPRAKPDDGVSEDNRTIHSEGNAAQ